LLFFIHFFFFFSEMSGRSRPLGGWVIFGAEPSRIWYSPPKNLSKLSKFQLICSEQTTKRINSRSKEMLLLSLFFVFVAIILGVFFTSDADLPLILLPKSPAKAHDGKIVWIVGASSGIGAALAVDFAREGAHVIISARRLSQLQEVADRCSKAGPFPALVLPMDVTKYEEHQTAFNHIMDIYGRVDVLVLNAGISQRNLANDTPFEVTEEIMHLNFFSLIHLNKLVLPTLLKQQNGKIVVMSSLSGIIGTPVASSYSASKWALHGISLLFLLFLLLYSLLY
jgi:hypothetical protein